MKRSEKLNEKISKNPNKKIFSFENSKLKKKNWKFLHKFN